MVDNKDAKNRPRSSVEHTVKAAGRNAARRAAATEPDAPATNSASVSTSTTQSSARSSSGTTGSSKASKRRKRRSRDQTPGAVSVTSNDEATTSSGRERQPVAEAIDAEVAEDIEEYRAENDALKAEKEELRRQLDSINERPAPVQAQVVDANGGDDQHSHCTTSRLLLLALLVVLVGVGVALGVVLSGNDGEGNPIESSKSPAPSIAQSTPTASPLPANQTTSISRDSEDVLRSILELVYGEIVAEEDSPQQFALEWMTNNLAIDPDNFEASLLVQWYALLVLYDATNGDRWFRQYDVVTNPPSGCNNSTSDLSGVLCDSEGTVLEIRLPSNNLRGSIPTEIGALSNLAAFQLNENSLQGTVPSEIGLLGKLEALNLSENFLSGSVPSTLSGLADLFVVHLFSNNFDGGYNDAFCDASANFSPLRADCLGNEETCSCCTECCNSTHCCGDTCFNT